MSERSARSLTRTIGFGLSVAAALLALAAPTAAQAADPVSPLETEITDLADLSTIGPDGLPDLLTLRAGGEGAGGDGVVATILRRADGRWTAAESRLELPDGPPWIAGSLGDGRFVVVAGRAIGGGTRTIAIIRASRAGVVVERHLAIPGAFSAAAVTDTDGDGSAELVVAAPIQDCRVGLGVFSAERLEFLRAFETVPFDPARATLANLDRRPGADLGSIVTSCAGNDADATRISAVGLSLRDGRVLGIARLSGEDVPTGAPTAIDIEGDGLDEIATQVGDAVAITSVGGVPGDTDVSLPGRALGIIADPDGPQFVIENRDADPAGVSFVRVSTGRADEPPAVIGRLAAEELGNQRLNRLHSAASTSQSSVPWAVPVDLAGDGCRSFLVSLVRTTCAPEEAFAPGPAWVSTRPLLVGGEGARRRLLVAAAMPTVAGLPPSPSPLAAGDRRGWQVAPLGSFVLAELGAGDVAYYRSYPQPSTSVTGTIRDEARTDVGAQTGVRMVIGIQTVPADAPEATAERTVEDAFGPLATGTRTVARTGVPGGTLSGVDDSFVRVQLPADELAPGVRPRWDMTIVALNDWGELSEPMLAAVDTDVVGPMLSVETEFLTAPWPFGAPLRGRTEPNAKISVDGGPWQEVSRSGRFEVRHALAPWPQTVEFRATDGLGNVTVRRVSVIGGIDFRRLPWEILVAGTVLLAVVGTTFLGARRGRRPMLLDAARPVGLAFAGATLQAGSRRAVRRSVAWGTEDPDWGAVPEIEELAPGEGLPPADPSGSS